MLVVASSNAIQVKEERLMHVERIVVDPVPDLAWDFKERALFLRKAYRECQASRVHDLHIFCSVGGRCVAGAI
jgi:hypothetical protein